MKKSLIWKIIIIAIIIVFSYGTVTTCAEGLLPSLSETVGIAMPSLGEALLRYPDSETENEDGSVTERYMNVSETDFNTFSIYLEQQEAQLADYKAEKGVLTAEIKAKGASFSLQYDSKSGEAKVTYPSGTFDERMKSAKTHFDAGQKLLEEGKADEALSIFQEIPQYSEYVPVADLLQNDDNLIAAVVAAAREAKCAFYRTPGNTVSFGHYEQDNNTANGMEEIEWIVLDYNEKEHKTLLLSKFGLDCKSYDTGDKYIPWAKCSLRTWLNDVFLQSAFSANEQAAILWTTVDNSASQAYSKWVTDGGNNTQDQIFLLSYAEANRYLHVTYYDGNYQARHNVSGRVAPTEYAIANGASTDSEYQTADGEAAGFWWLRSPGYTTRNYAAVVWQTGAMVASRVSEGYLVVRPALWLNLDADIF